MSEKEQQFPDHMWRRFERLGEMIGDGLHYEDKWILKEYNALAKVLCPPTKEMKAFAAQQKKEKNKILDEKITAMLQQHKCECGAELKQTRSGSLTSQCTNINCGKRYKCKYKKIR